MRNCTTRYQGLLWNLLWNQIESPEMDTYVTGHLNNSTAE